MVVRYMKLKDNVDYILNQHEQCRNDDGVLLSTYYMKFNNQQVFLALNTKEGVSKMLHNLFTTVDNPANIIRIRQKLQQMGKYMPTDLEVVKQRKINEEKWLDYMRQSKI